MASCFIPFSPSAISRSKRIERAKLINLPWYNMGLTRSSKLRIELFARIPRLQWIRHHSDIPHFPWSKLLGRTPSMWKPLRSGWSGKPCVFFPFGEKSLLSWWVKPVKPNPCQRFTRGIAVLPLDGFPWGGSLICKKKKKTSWECWWPAKTPSGWWFGCHVWHFPINIGNFIIPIDVHIFQRGGPTTKQQWWGQLLENGFSVAGCRVDMKCRSVETKATDFSCWPTLMGKWSRKSCAHLPGKKRTKMLKSSQFRGPLAIPISAHLSDSRRSSRISRS